MKTFLIAIAFLSPALSATTALAASVKDLQKCDANPKFQVKFVDEEGKKKQLGYFQYVTMMMSDDAFDAQSKSGKLKKLSQKIYAADPETARECLDAYVTFAKESGDEIAIETTIPRTRIMTEIVHGSKAKGNSSSPAEKAVN